MKIVVLNTGSGTVKSALVEVSGARVRALRRETVERRPGEPLEGSLREVLEKLDPPRSVDATAHRVVHGGTRFSEPVAVDGEVERVLESLTALAPLHNPPALEGIRVARRILDDVPAIAVFDTAFHAERSLVSRLYAIPWELSETESIYRYGFHGLAHASLVESLAGLKGCDPRAIDAVTLQLGSGCSACAVENGRSAETSMGFSPLEGLPMATRPGDLDPSIVLYLLRRGRSVDEIEDLLNRESGLLGLAGDADLRNVLRAEAEGQQRAAIAMTLLVRRLVATIGAYFTLLGGRGSLVFGGGIGTNSPELRRRVAAGLRTWDIALDPERNLDGRVGRISKAGFREVYVFETDEETIIAREAARVLRPGTLKH